MAITIHGKPQIFWDTLAREIGTTPRPSGQVDTTALGYAVFLPPNPLGTNEISDILNFVPDGVTAYPFGTGGVKPAITITDGNVTALEWITALNGVEVAAMSAGQAAYVDALTQYAIRYGSFVYVGRLLTQIQAVFSASGAGSTRSQLAQKATRSGSRAEQILIAATSDRQWLSYQVTVDDIVYLATGQPG